MLYFVNPGQTRGALAILQGAATTPFFDCKLLMNMEQISTLQLQEESDEVLIKRFNDGNKDAFDMLYTRHVSNVFKRVRYVVPESDVEDITQEVFIAAMKSLASFRGDSQFATWLRTLTNHKIAEFYRKRGRKQEPPLSPISDAFGKMDGNTSKMMEERIYIQKALNQLPENYREVILLRFAENMQFSQIAELQNQNLEATKSLFRRAIAALRNLLDE